MNRLFRFICLSLGLFVLFARTGWAADTKEASYLLQSGESHAAGDMVTVTGDDGNVVAMLTFGFAGEADFSASKSNYSIDGFMAYTSGNGVNGGIDRGTTYIIVPAYDGVVTVGVMLNANKAFYVLEDDVVMDSYNGIMNDVKYTGTYSFNVKAGSTYKVYGKGTKLGFFGFTFVYLTEGGISFNAYKLTTGVQPSIAGSVNPSGSQTLVQGATVKCSTSRNNSDYAFQYWCVGDSIVSSNSSFTFTMPARDCTLTAVYKYDPTNPANPDSPDQTKKHTLTLNTKPQGAGSFNRNSGEQYAEGQSVSLRAYNNTDFVFSHWTEDGKQISNSSSFNYTMPDHDAELTAVFNYQPGSPANPDTAQVYYTVSLDTKPANAGYFSWDNNTQRVAGSSGYIYAYNNTDFTFREWQQDGKVVGRNYRYDFTMPAKNMALVAVYDYTPSNPDNPGKNYWNAETGEVIVDDFTPGSLSSAVSNTIGGSSNRDKVQMMTIAGPINQSDWGVVNNYKNCTLLDLSRTYGMTYVPSYNFSDNNVLSSVVLPAGIETIDYYAFRNCSSLSSISILAATPPTIGYRAFEGIADSIVYVPADAISLYQEADGWKDFTILPLAKDVSSLEVNLPEGTDANVYKDMFIELVNAKSGQKLRYVITNRLTYTFNSLVHRTSYNVYLRNRQGNVLGQLDGIDIVDKDVSVTFPSLMVPNDLTLQVLTPAGDEVTAQTTITWMDEKGTYLAKGNVLTSQLEGNKVKFRINLPQSLGMQYQLPADSLYEVLAENSINVMLKAIPLTTIAGKVTDIKTGQPLSGATVAVSQMLNGLYSKSFTTKTDNKGQWSLQVFEAKTDVTASMTDYVNKTQSFETLVAEVPDFQLKDINGTTIAINLTYQPTGGELQEYYSDYANVAYTVYNETAGKNVTDLNVQYPQIVLMEQLPAGTVLRVTATSKNQKFVPVTATATVDDLDRASVTLPIVQLGGITASFSQTDNPAVVGILYDGNGRLLKKYEYASATLNINEMQDGQYTLVTMASTQLFSTVGSLSQFAEAGLREGVDYVKNSVTVRSGEMAAIDNPLIPFLDETKLYYTGDGTSISVNKSQITTGNYLTITVHLDFKSSYADQVSDVKLIVDLPEECAFVDNSVMRGAQTATYTYADNQVVVPLDYYGERVRFCFIPTASGEFTATGSVQFTLNGKTITQPIGNAKFMVKDLSISVPSTVAKTTMSVSGAAPGKSSVEIYDDGMLIGNTTSLANGTWITTCELDESYNLSTHNIYAKVTTKAGMELVSETKQVVYDKSMVEPEKVTMLYYNPEFVGQYSIVFDLINGTVSPKHYYFFPYKSWPNWLGSGTEPKDFTFIADLSNNDSTAVNGVTIRVYTDNGYWRNLEAQYNTSMKRWVAVSQFLEEEAPVGVEVEIDANNVLVVDDRILESYYDFAKDNISEYNNYVEECDSLINVINAHLSSGTSIDVEKIMNDYYSILSFVNNNNETSEHYNYLESLSEDALLEYIDGIIAELDSDYNELKSNVDLFSMDELTNQSIYGKINLEEDGIFDVKTEHIYNVSESELLSQGFAELNTVDGNKVYYFVEGSWVEMYDFTNDIHISYSNAEIAAMVRLASVDRRALDINEWRTIITNATNIVHAIEEKYHKIKELIDTRIKLNNEAIDFLRKYTNKACKEFDPLAKLYQKYGFPSIGDRLTKLNQRVGIFQKGIKNLTANSQLLNGLKVVGKSLTKGLNIVAIINDGYQAITDMNDWLDLGLDLRAKVEKCENYRSLYNQAQIQGYSILTGYVSLLTLDLTSVASVLGALGTAGTSLILSVGSSVASTVGGIYIPRNSANYKREIRAEIPNVPKCKDDDKCPRCGKNPCECKDKCPSCGNRPCTCPPKCPRCGKNPCVCPPPPNTTDVDHDPSGYVYEGVASNRLQGVMATCYYKETVEDMYGDLHENVVLWNAEEYAQENPLFTDEYGMYRWDVPKGLWQVKFEKEGYQTTYSEWLPVPPPQLEVNIAMTQMVQPSVQKASAYDEGVEMEFDKFMDPETLNGENIKVTKNGNVIEGTIELLNEEVAYEGQTQTYASKVRFNVPEGEELLSTDEVQLTVSRKVKSYAGVPMEEDYTQSFTVEPKVRTIAVDSLINVAYGGTRTLSVAALPVDASKGKKMIVKSLSQMIATVSADEVTPEENGNIVLTLDENGQAEIVVSGELPGSTVMSFAVEETDVEGQMKVNVKDATKLMTIAPRASRISGTQVYRGTEIRLTSETEGAEIYYTLDGTCPCNTETAIKYNPEQPIVIADDNVTIKAMAQGHDLAESDVAEFSYSLKKSKLGYQLPEGWSWISHNLESNVPVNQFQENAERILSQTSEVISDPVFGFIGNLTELLPTKAYKMKYKSQNEKNLQGYEFDATQNSVPVEAGWNWIGYPMNQSMTVAEALNFYDASEGDFIVGQDGYAEFTDGDWKGSLEGMRPGQGYLYKSAVNNEIHFNTTIVSVAASRMGMRNYLISSPWAPAKHVYPNVMPLTAQLYDKGSCVDPNDYVVGAFSGSECRGVGIWNDNRLLMNIYGQNGEDIHFVAKQLSTDLYYDLTEQLTFTADNTGTWNAPYLLTTGSQTTEITKVNDGMTVTPAVAKSYITVTAGGKDITYLTITNMSGQTVISLSDLGKGATVTLGQLPEGMYIVTVNAGGQSYYKKILKANK